LNIDDKPAANVREMFTGEPDEHGNTYKTRYLDSGQEFVILKNYFSEADLRSLWGGRFSVKSLICNEYYWSTVLSAGSE